jgi:ferrochelatase
MENKKIGVLVMAYGGPDSLDDIPGYLADIRSGRPTTPTVLEEITNNYRLIGGKSPLLEFTQKQVSSIASYLDPEKYKFYIGMRHWTPWVEETIRDMIHDGIEQAISIVMTPQFSKLSVAKYQQKIKAGLEMYRGDIDFAHIESYHDEPGLIQALANRVNEGVERWDQPERANVHVVFSAHSLPVRIMKMGDPYDSQLRETAALAAEKAGLMENQWSWSYQSAGRSPEPWLGPQIEDYLPELAKQGIKNVVSIPVGFVCDHVEILFDIDIQAQQVAKEIGMRLERPAALNTDPLFIEGVAKTIEEKAAEAGWVEQKTLTA